MKKLENMFKEIRYISSVEKLKVYFQRKHEEENKTDKKKIISTINVN